MREPTNISELFEKKEVLNIGAPMVRYSKVQFRNLVKHYDCDLCFTPMILADSFCQSSKARKNEFTSNLSDTPVIAQFAANTVHDFVGAAYIVSPFCDGVDLNCGCPQRWAKQLGLGCAMLDRPELIYDLTRQCRNRIPKPFSVSVKTRLCQDERRTVSICKQLEMCGVSFLTIHARTPHQNREEINQSALKLVAESVGIPVVANGSVNSLQEGRALAAETKCKGIMVANGILSNPTLFSGSPATTVDCVQRWLDICYNSTLSREKYESLSDSSTSKPYTATIPDKPPNLTFQCFHHHLVFMLEKVLPRKDKQVFNSLSNFADVFDFLRDYFNVYPRLFDRDQFDRVCLLDIDYGNRDDLYLDLKPCVGSGDENKLDIFQDCDERDGKFFKSKIEDDGECDWGSLFLETG